VISCKAGEFIVIARKSLEDNWFLASASKSPISLTFPLDFLDEGVTYSSERFTEDPSDPHNGAKSSSFSANKGFKYEAKLVAGGGDVAVFKTPNSSQTKPTRISGYFFFMILLPRNIFSSPFFLSFFTRRTKEIFSFFFFLFSFFFFLFSL